VSRREKLLEYLEANKDFIIKEAGNDPGKVAGVVAGLGVDWLCDQIDDLEKHIACKLHPISAPCTGCDLSDGSHRLDCKVNPWVPR